MRHDLQNARIGCAHVICYVKNCIIWPGYILYLFNDAWLLYRNGRHIYMSCPFIYGDRVQTKRHADRPTDGYTMQTCPCLYNTCNILYMYYITHACIIRLYYYINIFTDICKITRWSKAVIFTHSVAKLDIFLF